MIGRADITGVILCGGDARRMSGVEKPLQLLHDAPLVAHVQARLAPQVARVLVSANRSRETYAAYGDEVVPDGVPGVGPLGGLSSALDAMRAPQTPYLFSCPGDAPFLDRSLVSRLADALADVDVDIAVPHDGVRPQHLFLLMRTRGQSTRRAMSGAEPSPRRASTPPASLIAYLESGARSVHGWLETQRVAVVDAADIADSFVNINTPQDLQHARMHAPHNPRQDQEPL